MFCKINVFLIVFCIQFSRDVCEEKLINRVCKPKTLRSIDSAANPLGTDVALLFMNDLIVKLDLKVEVHSDHDHSKVREIMTLKNLSEKVIIKPPIDMVATDSHHKDHLYLTNCKLQTKWIVLYFDTRMQLFKGPDEANDCGKQFEHLMEQDYDTNRHTFYTLEYWDSEGLVVMEGVSKYYVRLDPSHKSHTEDRAYIKLIPDIPTIDTAVERDLNETKPFTGFRGAKLTAGFIHHRHWYLFGGGYYCRVLLNKMNFSECESREISHWISDCHGMDADAKDISLLAIVLVTITAMAILIIVIIVLLIVKEMRRQSTHTSGQKSTRGSTL